MQVIGPTYVAKPCVRFTGWPRWACELHGGGPTGWGRSPGEAYHYWREAVAHEHAKRYAHDPGHRLYFPGDPEWKWEVSKP